MKIETLNPGNAAIETQKFVFKMATAKKIRAYMKKEMQVGSGSYWWNNFVRPVNVAVRKKQETVTVYSAGFGASELCQIAAVCGVRS